MNLIYTKTIYRKQHLNYSRRCNFYIVLKLSLLLFRKRTTDIIAVLCQNCNLWRSCKVTHSALSVLLLSVHTFSSPNRAYFYIYHEAVFVIPHNGKTKLLWILDAARCRITATWNTWHERQAFSRPILAIFCSAFLRFRPPAIRNRYRYWWNTNDTTRSALYLNVTHHFVMRAMGYRISLITFVQHIAAFSRKSNLNL